MCHYVFATALREQSVTEWKDNNRLAMKLFPVHSLLCSSFLCLWASQSETEANSPNVCEDEKIISHLLPKSSVQRHNVEEAGVLNKFHCRLYPTNLLNCSWSFDTFHKDAQFVVYISACNQTKVGDSLKHLSEENVGSASMILQEYKKLYVILQFNVTLHDKWTLYTYTYDMAMLETLSPPQTISASVKDGDLLVTWALPNSRVFSEPSCFEYQLVINDQESPEPLREQLSYTEPNADPNHMYKVRIRTRLMEDCQENSQWSGWSHTVTVEPSSKLNLLVIISISLGIPMILLAVLLLARFQRLLFKTLFPPIPRPPPKYIYFLEKNDPFGFFHPAPSAEPAEEITEVEDTEQNPSKTS